MAIEGFDYKGFAASMSEQAKSLVPADMEEAHKEYIVKTLGNFTLLAGEALYNDEELKINADQAVFITQIIAEWSFHKSIDLIKSGILPQYWDSIMQKIAFTIFEIAKQAIIRKIPQDQLLQAVEHHVVKVYQQSIEELEQKGLIDEEVKNQAVNQSNIDAMAQQAKAEQEKKQQEMAAESARNAEEAQKRREEKRAQRRAEREAAAGASATVKGDGANVAVPGLSYKQLRMMSLALVLKILSQDKVMTILNKFDSNDSLEISQYMNMADLESHIDSDLITDCLKDLRGVLPLQRKLTQENVVLDLLDLYKVHPRENIEKVIRKERPLVKRFIAQAYDGEYGELPLRVAGIVAQYISESI